MPRCCVPYCKGNYSGYFPKVSVFSFPKDPQEQEKWIRAIQRQNFKFTKSSRVCELHFKPHEIERISSFLIERTGEFLTAPLKTPRLAKGAIPSCALPDPNILSAEYNSGSIIPKKNGESIKKIPNLIQTDLGHRSYYNTVQAQYKCVICDQSEYRTRSLDVSYHPFPDSNKDLHWKIFCSQAVPVDILLKPDSLLCSLHFNKSDFWEGRIKRLKSGAVPSILNPLLNDGQKECVEAALPDILDDDPIEINNSSDQAIFNKNACRICLKEDSEIIHIESEVTFEDLEILNLAKVFQCLTGESRKQMQNPDLPKGLCQPCIHLMVSAYDFRKKYELSVQHFKRVLQSKVKSKTEVNVDFEGNYDHKIYEFPRELDAADVVIIEDDDNPENNLENGDTMEEEELNLEPPVVPPKLHRCPVCEKDFTALDLRKHSRQHESLKSYIKFAPKFKKKRKFYANPRILNVINNRELMHTCPFCNETFNGESFREHVRAHEQQGNYKCKICNRTFLKINHLKGHQLVHKKEAKFNCDQCDARFFAKFGFECHKLTHLANPETKYRCPFCSAQFYDYHQFRKHRFMHNNSVSYTTYYKAKQWECSDCNKQDPNHVCNFKCDRCHETFTKKEFNKHACRTKNANKTNKKGKNQLLCYICGKNSNSSANMWQHMRTHLPKGTKTKSQRFLCPECGKDYAAPDILNTHIKDVHRKAGHYACKKCDQSFSIKWQLRNHMRYKHGQFKPMCKICDKTYATKESFKRHLSEVHSLKRKNAVNIS